MLNKDICMKCLNDYSKQVESDSWPWDTFHEINWVEGIILCPAIFTMIKIDKIPEKCFHRFEQSVSAGMTNA